MWQRVLMVAMILVQVFALEHALLRFEWFPLILAGIAVAGLPGWLQLRLRRNTMIAAALALAAFMYVGTGSLLFQTRLPVVPFLPDFLYPAGWYCLALQVVVLFIQWPANRLSLYLPILGTATMTYAGMSTRADPLEPHYHLAAVLFVVFAASYWQLHETAKSSGVRASRWREVALRGGLLLLAISISVGSSLGVGVYRNQIDQTFMRMVTNIAQDNVGFSQESRLSSVSSVRSKNSTKVALRVTSATTPGYLRGRTYDRYVGSRWTITVKPSPLRGAQNLDGMVAGPGQALFSIGAGTPPWNVFEVRPAQRFGDSLFVPLGATAMAVNNGAPGRDDNENLFANEAGDETNYSVAAKASGSGDAPAPTSPRWLQLPDNLDPGVRTLAAQILANCDTTAKKYAAVVDYFEQHYQYKLGIQVPPGKDPISYFLLEHPPAHCEYFATGAVILLRLEGVPARYVTGFVTTEKNSYGGYWLARNRDAHAWVEAYDDVAHAWVTVEPTVANGVPGAHPQAGAGMLHDLFDFASYTWQRLMTTVRGLSWPTLTVRPWMWALMAMLGGVLACAAAWRRHKRWRRQAYRSEVMTAETRALVQLRKKRDRRARRLGFVRAPEETVLAFARRIQAHAEKLDDTMKQQPLLALAAWYQCYNEARFAGPITPQTLVRLRHDTA